MVVSNIYYASGMLIVVNFIISLYVVIYAYLFLLRTKHYEDRKPWELLFIAAIFFLISHMVGLSLFYGKTNYFGIDTTSFGLIMSFVYTVLVLLAFITQSNLILKSDMIVITRNVKTRKELKEFKKSLSK